MPGATMSTTAPIVESADPFVGDGGRYVVGVNGSAAGAAAVDWVLSRSGAPARVHLLGVVEEVDAAGSAVASVDAALSRAARIAYDAQVGVTRELVAGRVPLAIARAARQSDLVVIGSDKTGFARGRLYGLRAVQLAAVVPGSLAVVPSVDLRLRSGVGVAVADEAGAERLARVGAREARRRGCSLALVHAMPPSSASAAQGDGILAVARAAAHEECPEIDVWARVVHRRAADAILNLSRDKAVLIVGRSRSTTVLGVGETLHEVLLNTNAPTVVCA